LTNVTSDNNIYCVMPKTRSAPASPRRLDAVDASLLLALSRDGRRPAADLAKELGLSRQAVTERIRDLERRRVIRGYRADVEPGALSLGVRAHIRIAMSASASLKSERALLRRLVGSPMVRAVHRVSGEDCFVAQVVCRRIEDVSGLLAELRATRAMEQSRTAFVLETIVEKGSFGAVDGLLPADGSAR
jgi:Lrp/AsnC family transcriptional regulator, leucine-responsive regulatory protein